MSKLAKINNEKTNSNPGKKKSIVENPTDVPIAVTYFKLNKYNQRLPLENETFFCGNVLSVRNSWRPCGEGEFLLNDKKLIKGTFNKEGFLQGNGEIQFYRNEKEWCNWTGGFQNGGIMNGSGILTDKDGNEIESIMKNNILICTKNDLQIGQQIEFCDIGLQLHSGLDYSSRAIILNHIKNWKYRVRMHDDVRPRERDVRNLNLIYIISFHYFVYIVFLYFIFLCCVQFFLNFLLEIRNIAFHHLIHSFYFLFFFFYFILLFCFFTLFINLTLFHFIFFYRLILQN